MSEVFIPLGGAGGKNRGSQYKIPENAQTVEMFGSIFFPLPPGVYKKLVLPNGQPALPSDDGGDAAVTMSKEFFKKQAIKTFGIASITNFSLSMFAHKQVRLTWAKPSQGLWSGVHFVFKYGSMPTSETDGFMVYDSADVHYETARLDERELFVRAYSYVTVTDGRWYDEGKVSAKITVTGISGSVTLGVGAGTWTVPDKVEKIRYIIVGQGGNGEDNGANLYGAGGGGGGGYFETGYLNVTPGQNLSYVVPAPLNRANSQTWSKYYRGEYIPECDTIFAGIRAQHGRMAIRRYPGFDNSCLFIGGDGGSGGGGGNGGIGGRNGADGTSGGVNNISRRTTSTGVAGKGSHKSTTGFNGVLYSTGGNGASPYTGLSGQPGTNGLGNGGSGGGGGSVYCSGGTGGTGCIYIAWGSAMNDGT